jgi:hypothetical protein
VLRAVVVLWTEGRIHEMDKEDQALKFWQGVRQILMLTLGTLHAALPCSRAVPCLSKQHFSAVRAITQDGNVPRLRIAQ